MATTAAVGVKPGRPAIFSADPTLLESLVPLVSAAGGQAQVCAEPAAQRAAWGSAALILVGHDAAMEVIRLRPERRAGVVLVGRAADPDGVWELAFGLGAEQVAILPEAAGWLADRIADVLEGPQPAGRLIAVVPGKGGAGASTLAAGLAIAAARRGHETVLVDADPMGGGLDLALGLESAPGSRWAELVDLRGRIAGAALRAALPRLGSLGVLACAREGETGIEPEPLRCVLRAARLGSDLVVLDLPRPYPHDVEPVPTAADTVLVVVPAEVRAVAAARRVVANLREQADDVRAVVRVPGPAGLSPGSVAAAVDLPLAGTVRTDGRLRRAQERGERPYQRGSLGRFCQRLVAESAVGCPGAAGDDSGPHGWAPKEPTASGGTTA